MTAYISLGELREYIRDASNLNDESLLSACTAASREVDDICGRGVNAFAVPTTTDVKRFVICHTRLLRVPDIATTTGLVIESGAFDDYGTIWTSDEYLLVPFEPQDGWPYEAIRAVSRYWPLSSFNLPTVQITARWGWPETPEPVKQATKILAAEKFALAGAPLGVIPNPDFGGARARAPMQALSLLSPYKKMSVLVE